MNEPRRTQSGFDVRPTMTGFEGRQTQVVALDDEAILDLRSAANFVGYIMNSWRRRRRLALFTAALTFVLVAALAVVMPRTYRIEMRVLTHKSATMSALVHPDAAIPQSADVPTAGAVELVKSTNNLEDLLADTDLEKIWAEKRGPFAKFKDKTLAKIFGAPDKSDLHEAYLKMIDDKVDAQVEGEVVLLNVEWDNPEIAMKLAEAVVTRFLHMRRDLELGEVVQSVEILGRNVESSRLGIEAVVKRMQKVLEDRETDLQVRGGTPRGEAKRAKVHKSRFISIRKPVRANRNQTEGPGGELRKQLADKQSALSLLQRSYRDRLGRAEDELSNLRASLGPDHPDVIEAKHKLEMLAKERTEMGALESEQQNLATQVSALPKPLEPDTEVVQQPIADDNEEQKFDLMRVPVSEDLYKEMDKDPEVMAVLDELKRRQEAHDGLVRRLDSARITRDTSIAAFNYRYKLTQPPVMPKEAVKPKVPVMLGGGLVAALILGMVLALFSDLLSGRILESWQVQRFLKVKMLGELDAS